MSQFVQWWHENPDRAEDIRAKRRRKLKDPEAAEAHRQRCRDYYAKTKQSSGKTRGLNKPKCFWINGLPVQYWGAGQVCQFLGVSTSTLRTWENRDVIPVDVKIVDAVRRRWFPAAFVQRLQPLVLGYISGDISSLYALRSQVHGLWQTFKNEETHEYRAEVPPNDDHGEPNDQVVGEG